MKLKYMLVVAFIAMSTIPLFLGLYYLNTYTANQYRTQTENTLSALSLIEKNRITAVLERIQDDTSLIVSRTQMRLSLDQWNRTQDGTHAEKIRHTIQDATEELTRLYNITIFDPLGNHVTAIKSDGEKEPLKTLPEQDKQIQLNRKDNRIFIVSIARIRLEGNTIGYAKLEFFADFLLDLVNNRTGLGDTGEWLFAVRNRNGDALFAVPLKYDQDAAFRRTVPKIRTDVPITQALLGNEIIMSNAPDYHEVPVLASTRYLPEQDWGLVAKINESEVNGLLEETNRFLFILALGIIIFSAVIGFIISHYIASPVEKLKKQTGKISLGDYEEQPVTGSWQEARELTVSFNQMASSLKELKDDLNKKVIERTRELDEANQKLREISVKDPLTDLYNRRFLKERLSQEFQRARRYGTGLTLVIFDIDHFKKINDTWGYAAGDKVLKAISVYLKKCLRSSDVVGRIGGEEFCLLLPTPTQTVILPIVERIRIAISELECQVDDKVIQVTCSFGVAVLTENTESTEELMKNADKALYEAKGSGRNRVIQYEEA